MPDRVAPSSRNRSGAGGDIGVARRREGDAPTAITLLLHTSSYVINATIPRQVQGDCGRVRTTWRGSAPSSSSSSSSQRFSPYNRLRISLRSPKSGKNLSYGSTGPRHHAAYCRRDAERRPAGIKAVHVPYRGLNPAFTDILGGQIDYIITSVIGVLAFMFRRRQCSPRWQSLKPSARRPNCPTSRPQASSGFLRWCCRTGTEFSLRPAVPEKRRNEIEATLMQVLRAPKVSEQLVA